MSVPDPSNERRQLSVDEFLRTCAARRRSRYQQALEPLPEFSDFAYQFFKSDSPPPGIAVLANGSIGETCVSELQERIIIAEGLLKSTLLAQKVANTLAKDLPTPLGDASVTKTSLLWAYAHELTHYARRHRLVEKQFGSNQATLHALEYDADMCSVEILFLHFMECSPTCTSALEAKMAVFANLFWCIRLQMGSGEPLLGSASHPHAATRVFDIISKLATLHAGRVKDSSFKDPATIEHAKALGIAMAHWERAYMQARRGFLGAGLAPEHSPLLKFLEPSQRKALVSERHERWEQIAPVIHHFERISRVLINEDHVEEFAIDPLGRYFWTYSWIDPDL